MLHYSPHPSRGLGGQTKHLEQTVTTGSSTGKVAGLSVLLETSAARQCISKVKVLGSLLRTGNGMNVCSQGLCQMILKWWGELASSIKIDVKKYAIAPTQAQKWYQVIGDTKHWQFLQPFHNHQMSRGNMPLEKGWWSYNVHVYNTEWVFKINHLLYVNEYVGELQLPNMVCIPGSSRQCHTACVAWRSAYQWVIVTGRCRDETTGAIVQPHLKREWQERPWMTKIN